MALIKLGRLIGLKECRNTEGKVGVECVKGISTQKLFIETKADMEDVSLHNYKIVEPKSFAYVADTSRRGDKISLAYNFSKDCYLVSSISTVFYVKDEKVLLPEYLYIYFNRPEFDRFSRFNSWGSAREAFSYEDMCDIEIELPDITIQQKYVDIYNAMVANQECYEQGLEDLKLACDAYIEDLRRKTPCEKIRKYIEESKSKNTKYLLGKVLGVNKDGSFQDTIANMDGIDLKNYKVVNKHWFSYSNRINIGSIAMRREESCLVSSSYRVFFVKSKTLLPEYLELWIRKDSFPKFAWFYSLGSVKDEISVDELGELQIPIPPIETQKDIVHIFNAYNERKEINEKLKTMIKDICPILIKGSLEEGRK